VISFVRKKQNPTRAPEHVARTRSGEHAEIVAALEALVARRIESSIPRHSGRLLGALLVHRGYLVQSDLEKALARQAETRQRLGEVVVELGFVREKVVVELVAEQLRIDVFDPHRFTADVDLARCLPEADARRLEAVPIRQVGASIHVAVADPTRPHLVTELIRLLHAPVRLYATTHDAIDDLISRGFDADRR
jgi:hypothetical protein